MNTTTQNMNMATLKIGFMGVHGSFSEKASLAFVEKHLPKLNSGFTLFPLVDAFHVRDALLKHDIDLGVVAVRNTTTGTVAETAEAFHGMDVIVLDEFALPVHQCLFKLHGVPTEELTTIASHPQALMQTRNTCKTLFVRISELVMEDTSLSAKMLADGRLPADTAVICSKEAGLMNDLELIAENIEDNPNNKTIFHLIRLG